MTDLIKWPFKRKQYAGLDNPRFVSDIVAANEGVIAAIKTLAGLPDTGFAIISGLDFVTGISNSFTAGFFYLDGSFYYYQNSFAENYYLQPVPTDIMPKAFPDTVSRNIYTVNNAALSITGGSGYTPQFVGNMNQYRIGSRYLADKIISLLATQAALGDAAFLNVGTTAGTVAAGDYSYSKTEIDVALALKANIANTFNVLLKGTKTVGSVPDGGQTITISFGVTLADSNYKVHLQVISLSATASDDTIYVPSIRTRTTTEMTVHLQPPAGSSAANINIDWEIFK